MGEVDWTPALIALCVGIGVGIALALHARRGPALAEGDTGRTREERRRVRIEDLRQRKGLLLQQIRDLEDTALPGGIASAMAERENLMIEAARVLRELSSLGAELPSASAGPGAPAATHPPRGLSPELRGALLGGAVVGFLALLAVTLSNTTRARQGDMPMTGGSAAEETADLPPPGSGRPGEPVRGVPPALRPQPSERLDAARAAVAASPTSADLRAELGWALVDAEGWIDVFNNAEQLLELSPEHPDALTQQAVVRMRMGQSEVAEELVDRALLATPGHGRALAWKGSLRWQAEDAAGARTAWSEGLKRYPGEGFEALLDMAEGRVKPADLGLARGGAAGSPHGGGADAGSPPGGGADAPAAAGSRSADGVEDRVIQGTIELAPGTSATGAVVFVYARAPGVTRGPPLAALRLDPSRFPLSFRIGPDDSPMPGGPFPAQVTLSARLDQDGDAMSKDGPEGATEQPVAAGTSGVRIVLR